MRKRMDELEFGDRFIEPNGAADGHEGEPEPMQVLGAPDVKGFACRVRVKSLVDGFIYTRAGNPADTVEIQP